MEQSSDLSFTPLVAVELASDTSEEAIKWLLSRIGDKPQSGGVESCSRLQVHLNLFNPSTCARC